MRIDPPAGVDKLRAWPVTFGAPFPAGSLWDVARLRVVDLQGNELPAQKEVAGRWAPDGAIKWVRFDALVSAAAGCVVELADAGIIGAMSDDVQLIVRMGRTPRPLVEQAIRTLSSYNAPVAGLIATDQTRHRGRYYYKYGYRYRYRYHYTEKQAA